MVAATERNNSRVAEKIQSCNQIKQQLIVYDLLVISNSQIEVEMEVEVGGSKAEG